MNRLQTTAADSLPAPVFDADIAHDVAAAKFSLRRGDSPLAMFGPLHYEAGYAYPLIVWLHGPGDDETQLKRIMPLVSMRNYVAVAPRAPASVQTPVGRCGFTWSAGKTGVAERRIAAAVAAAVKRYHVNRDRIFLAGFDVGGTMAFRAAMHHAHRVAGVVSLGGGFPRSGRPLARLAEARRVAVFVACGEESRRYTPQQVCHDLRLFHAAGMNASVGQYPCGQQLHASMLADMNRWIMEQIGAA